MGLVAITPGCRGLLCCPLELTCTGVLLPVTAWHDGSGCGWLPLTQAIA